MIMNIEEFDRITLLLKESVLKQQKYVDSLPEDLVDIITDNVYTRSVGYVNDRLIEAVFKNEELVEHVFWYLYEWTSGESIIEEGVKYTINHHKDFVETTKQIYKLPS